MTHYFDLGFLLCLVTKAPGSGLAWDVVRPLPQPLLITAFQAVQVENGLRKRLFQRGPQAQAVAAKAWGLWEFYKREMVFALAPVPWDAAFTSAQSIPRPRPGRRRTTRRTDPASPRVAAR